MAMVKEVIVDTAKNGVMHHEKEKERQANKRWGNPLHPSGPTTIDKAILDKAVTDAIEKRLGSKR